MQLTEAQIRDLHCEASERQIAFALLNAKEADIDLVIGSLVPSDFYHHAPSVIMQVVTARYRERKNITKLHCRSDAFRLYPNDPALHDLFNAMQEEFLTAANLRSEIRTVKDKAKRRSLLDAAQKIWQAAASQSADAAMEIAEQSILASTETTEREETLTTAFAKFMQVVDDRRDRHRTGKALPGVASPLASLNTQIQSFQPGHLIIIGARPGMGKSALAGNIVSHAARNGQGSYFASLEMNTIELVERIVSEQLRLNANVMRNGVMNDQQYDDVIATGEELASWAPVIFDDSPRQTVWQIRSAARRHKSKHDIKFVVVDYLQLIHSDNARGRTRDQIVGEIGRQLKIMAKELQIPVIALCQLNREVESRAGSRPKPSDLRESGELEQHADVILLLHEFRKDANQPPQHEIVAGKVRGGRTGVIPVVFEKEFSRFTDIPDDTTRVFGQSAPGDY